MKFFLSKILIIFIFLLSTFYLLPSVAHANTTPQASNYPVANTNPDVPNNLHNWTQNVMIEVMSALTCQLAGVDPINPKQGCLGIDSASGKIGFLPSPQAGGAIGFMGNMIATLYTPPLHTGDYFRDLASNFGINKKAYAQSAGGTGFQGLTPLIGVWSAFRNIVYLFLVIIFVVIGLAIMLRVKIDPRTVMSIQNQIPKIIIGILVVTFSFAIAGFLIDLMWVSIYLIYGIFSGIPGASGTPIDLQALNPIVMQGKNAMGAAGGIGSIVGITFHAGNGIVGVISDMLGLGFPDVSWASGIIHLISVSVGTYIGLATEGFKFLGTNIVVDKIGAGIAAAAGVEVGLRWAIPYLIAYLVIFIALLTALFRLWFVLIMAYVHILIDVVLAPFWIIGGIVPGSPISLSGWIRDISANLLAFPVTIAMFMLGKVFMDAFGSEAEGQFVPPLIGNPGDPSLIGSLIGLGIILMTPNVVNMLKAALKAPKIDTGGIGASLRAGAGVVGGTTKSTVGAGSAYLLGDPLTGATGAKGLRQALTRKLFG